MMKFNVSVYLLKVRMAYARNIKFQQPLRITTILVNILSTKFVSSCAISCRE